MSKKHRDYEVVDQEGLGCPRCGRPSETRKHKIPLKEKILKQPFYYTVWFNCKNTDCKTTIFMSEDYKIMKNNLAAKHFKNLQEDQENLDFISNIRLHTTYKLWREK